MHEESVGINELGTTQEGAGSGCATFNRDATVKAIFPI